MRLLNPLPGDILLFHHPERFRSLMISLFTGSPYYHVALYAGDGEVIEARLPRVVKRSLYFEQDGYRFVVLRAPSTRARQEAMAWATERIGAPYDLRSVLFWGIGHLMHIPALRRLCPPDRYVCGNFVVRAYTAAGVTLFPNRCAEEIMPGDFASLAHCGRHTRLAKESRRAIPADTPPGRSADPFPIAPDQAGRRSICLSSAMLPEDLSASSSLTIPAL